MATFKHHIHTLAYMCTTHIHLYTIPGLPTINRTSAISSLLNMAAFLSLTVDFVACQFGSSVDKLLHVRLKFVVLMKLGEASGDVGALAGCVICIASLWEMPWGGERDKPPLLIVSTETKLCQTYLYYRYQFPLKNN